MKLLALALLSLTIPATATAQAFSVYGAAGPTLGDRGYSATLGFGFSPTPRVTIAASLDHSHLVTRRTDFPGGSSLFRGGTATLGAGEVRVALFGPDRIGPYGLAGFAAGVSRPNVNDEFPVPVTNEVRAPFAGGGLRVPLGPRLLLTGDIRLMLVAGTDADDLMALTPVRFGLTWRF